MNRGAKGFAVAVGAAEGEVSAPQYSAGTQGNSCEGSCQGERQAVGGQCRYEPQKIGQVGNGQAGAHEPAEGGGVDAGDQPGCYGCGEDATGQQGKDGEPTPKFLKLTGEGVMALLSQQFLGLNCLRV